MTVHAALYTEAIAYKKLTKRRGEPGLTQRKTFDLSRSYADGLVTSLTILAAGFE
jgi:hypothetical protein